MNPHFAPHKRRALTAATATLTAAATLLALGAITAVTSAGTQASAAVVGEDPTPTPGALLPTPDPATGVEPSASSSASASATPSASVGVGSLLDVKNVVLVLADDMDWAVFESVPRLAALKAQGMTFTNNTVTDSLCCPSRTSIFRSQYLHNHHVLSNVAESGGGWQTFRKLGEQRDCLPVWLKAAQVRTGLFGKYLNGYEEKPTKGKASVPPGWDAWAVPASGKDSYSGYNYALNVNGRWKSYGRKQSDFLNDVITTKSLEFIRTAPDGFFAELATFNPHRPSPVAARNKGTHLNEVIPRTPNYNAYGTNEPSWLAKLPPLSPQRQGVLDYQWRQRAQSAESVADSIDAIRAELAATGRDKNTLIVVTADNGYHAASHRLRGGKRTAFREDTVVPLVVIGPGITPGASVSAMTSTIDLAPTLGELLHAPIPAWTDGRSLVPILSSGTVPADWRTGVLTESMGRSTPDDPDFQQDAPPQFSALRTPDWLYVFYRNGERELYDLKADPYEMNNVARTVDPSISAQLNAQLQALRACAGPTCRTADSMPAPTLPTPAGPLPATTATAAAPSPSVAP